MTNPHATPSRNLPADLEELRRLRGIVDNAIAVYQRLEIEYSTLREQAGTDREDSLGVFGTFLNPERILILLERIDSIGPYLTEAEDHMWRLSTEKIRRRYAAGGLDETSADDCKLVAEYADYCAQICKRLETDLVAKIEQPAPARPTNSASGFLGGQELREALGIPQKRQEAFQRKLDRSRGHLRDSDWMEAANPHPNAPKYTYRVDSEAVRKLAEAYKSPKPA